MKKFLSVLLLIAALIVGGCSDKPVTSITGTADNRIVFEADDASGGSETGGIDISDGEVMKVDVQITSGKFILEVEGQEYEFDKSGESFIEMSAGMQKIFINPKNGLTGKIIFSAVPKP